MPRTAPRWAVLAGVTLGLAACQAPAPNQNAALLKTLHPAEGCSADLPTFGRFARGSGPPPEMYLPPDGRIAMVNDGGWCTINFTYAMYEGLQPIVAPLRVRRPPAHGEVEVGSVGPSMRIAYRPKPGFAGPDDFSVHMGGPQPWNIPVQVMVIRGSG
jgi:hypothetical protein